MESPPRFFSRLHGRILKLLLNSDELFESSSSAFWKAPFSLPIVTNMDTHKRVVEKANANMHRDTKMELFRCQDTNMWR